MNDQPPRVKPPSRSLLALVCLGPIALLLASLAWGSPFSEWRAAGLALAIIAVGVGLFNSYLTFVRPALYRWRHGSLQGLKNVSVFPAIGTGLIVLAGLIGFGDRFTAVLGLLAAVLDTGGLPWVFLSIWTHPELWDS
jgi:hypothetical protein